MKVERALITVTAVCAVVPLLLAIAPQQAWAVPAFARQTGQNCQACHIGGQFPELTPYGRLFKLTGYTIGQRELPFAVMAVGTAYKVKNNDPTQGVTQDGSLVFNTASLFVAGKITDNIGGFSQFTYNKYDSQDASGAWSGAFGSDNLDVRYADHLINTHRDLIYGLTLNNNPGVEDVFNSMPAWGFAVVPGSTGIGDGTVPILDGGLGQQAAGLGAYAYWHKTLYAELSGYRTGNGVFSFMTQGVGPADQVHIKGTNPYVRVAVTKFWGPSNIMLGYTHFDVKQYSDPSAVSGPTDDYKDNMVDAQYQYLLDPYTFTAEAADVHETIDWGASGTPSDTVDELRAKASFTYQAKYGATLSYFKTTNTTNNLDPANSTGWTPEVFWIPIQNVRLGLQYTTFSVDQAAYNANAKDNNTLFFYVWGAY